jgi:hypothetical protein
MIMWSLRCAALFAFLGAATGACGGGGRTGPTQPSSPSAVPVNATDRIAWTQRADSAADLRTYQFGMYVDGRRVLLDTPECLPQSQSGDTYDCAVSLPPLSAGRHTLELVAISGSGPTAVESPHSATLVVTVGSASSASSDR